MKIEAKKIITPSITMIGYGEISWLPKLKNWPILNIAPQKGITNIYVAGIKNGKTLPEYYKQKLNKVSCGKSCIRVRKTEHLILEKLVSFYPMPLNG